MTEALWKEFVFMVSGTLTQIVLMLTLYTLVTVAVQTRRLNAKLD
jgi:hypothetical protein